MLSIKPITPKLKSIYMGVALGLAAVIIYITFQITYQMGGSEQMVLVPISSEISAKSKQ